MPFLLGLLLLLQAPAAPHQAPRAIRIAVQGETNLAPNFIESFKRESQEMGLRLTMADRRSAGLDYNIIIAQESTMGSAAAAIVVLSPDGDLVTSVVRSGRLSGRGAINACAKELAKKLVLLTQ
jgi:hypothetical protein